jgi:membrane associated rhomboid family serine protease
MVVIYLIAITVIASGLQLLLGNTFTDLFKLVPGSILSRPWTLVTSIFLHDGLIHIFFNMFGLLMFGPLLQSKVGKRNFLIIYFASGIIGNIGYIVTSGLGGAPVLGASGAIYGILGALAIIQPNLLVLVGFVPMPIYMAAIFWFFMEFSSGVTGAETGIANFAHVFGLVGGLALGRQLKHNVEEKYNWN